jgi:glycerol-3-phosphate acyltransferase PlsY
MDLVILTLIAFLFGSIPFSVIVGRLAARVDIRDYGDHNPGATNVLRAANWRSFAVAVVLDSLKGLLPVGISWFFLEIHGWTIIPIALAPVLGHAFSPLLRFQGGKAVAVTFGIWAGLTLFAGPTVLGLLLPLMTSVFVVSGWATTMAMLAFGGFLWLQFGTYRPELLAIWLGNLAVFFWKQREDLQKSPGIRPWLLRLIGMRP